MTNTGNKYVEELEKFVLDRNLGLLPLPEKLARTQSLDLIWEQLTEDDVVEVKQVRDKSREIAMVIQDNLPLSDTPINGSVEMPRH